MRAFRRCSAIVCSSASRRTPGHGGAALLALVPVLVASTACKPKPPRIVVGRVVIDAPREYDQASQWRALLRSGIEQRLAGDSSVVLDEGEREATHFLQVRIGELVEPVPRGDEPSVPEGVRPVEVRLRPFGAAPLFETAAVARGTGEVAPVLAAFDEAWAAVKRERILEVEPDATLITALSDTDARIRDFAVIRLGDRKSKEAVPALCALLEAELKPELVLRAIGSLVAIGDERATVPIIDLSRRKDPEFVLQVVYAVGAIGGRTAEAYLLTMASGHPVEAVRHGAEQALKEMRRPAPGG